MPDTGQHAESTRGHGSWRGYKLGCRCDDCRGAWADYHRSRRRAGGLLPRADYLAMARRDNHGVISRYHDGCRCDRCREAARLSQRRYREQKRLAALNDGCSEGGLADA